MKGVCFQSIGKVAYLDLPDPIIEHPMDAIVRVELAGMCGSDLHPFFGRETGLDAGTVMGHEFVGKVVAVGSEVRTISIGDRIFAPFSTSCGTCFYCQRGLTSRCIHSQLFGWRSSQKGLHGGQAELVRVPHADGTLAVLPKGISPESALLLGDNWSTGYFCAELANLQEDGLAVVIGCGSVGLLALQAAKLLGAKRIVAIDRVPQRRQRAIELGAIALEPNEDAVRQVKQMTEGRGADSVLELVGLPEAQRLAYDLLRPGGTMSVIGCHSAPHFAFSPSEAYDKNITYRTGRCPARHYMSQLLPGLSDNGVDLKSLITHRFDPADCVRAYDIFAHQKDGCIKSVFEFGG